VIAAESKKGKKKKGDWRRREFIEREEGVSRQAQTFFWKKPWRQNKGEGRGAFKGSGGHFKNPRERGVAGKKKTSSFPL